MAKYLKYQLGDLFAVPLERGGYGVIAAVRSVPKYKVKRTAFATVYGFDRIFEQPPPAEIAQSLRPTDACHFLLMHDDCIVSGAYPKVGSIPDFCLENWLEPPWRTGRNNLCMRSREGEYGSTSFHADDYVTPEEMAMLPWAHGLAGCEVIQSTLDSAIRGLPPEAIKRRAELIAAGVPYDLGPPPRFPVTEAHFALWRRVIRKLLEDGLIQTASC